MATSKAKGSTTATPSHHASTSTSTSSGGGNHHGSGTGGNSGSGGGSRGGESSSTVTASSSKHHNNTNITGETHAKRLNKGKELVGKEIPPTLDFNTLDISVLRRYKRIHKLKVKDYATKEELVAAVTRHYTSQPVKEIDVIAAFLYTVHNKDNVLKLQIP